MEVGPLVAVCHTCGAAKDLALGRCAACGRLPVGGEREDAILCSRAFLDEDSLRNVQARLRRGEPLLPSAALRQEAREHLAGIREAPLTLSRKQLAALVAADVLLTPLIGYAVWFRLRTRGGPAARQALTSTLAVSMVLGLLLVAWRALSFAPLLPGSGM